MRIGSLSFTMSMSIAAKWAGGCLMLLPMVVAACPATLQAQAAPASSAGATQSADQGATQGSNRGSTAGDAGSSRTTTSNAPDSGAVSAVDPARYVIGPEDTLVITVWKEPTLSGSVPVRPDGMISMALIGDIKAAGLKPMQLSASIADKLKKYVQDPNVSVVVTGVNSQHIYVVGEVNRVGAVNLVAGMSPLQAIAAAGGLSPYANKKHIYILRGDPAKQQKIPFDYKRAMKGTIEQDVTLQPGDTIVVR